MQGINALIKTHGLTALLLLMISNGSFSMPPSEAVLALGGAWAASGHFSLYSVCFVSIVGNFIGTIALYFLGKHIGIAWIDNLRNRISSLHVPQWLVNIAFANPTVIEALSKYLRTRGAPWIGIWRCFPVIRSIVSVPAGMIGMPMSKFIFWTLAGISIWDLSWIGVGYFLGENWNNLSRQYVTAILIVLGLLCLVFVRRVRQFHFLNK